MAQDPETQHQLYRQAVDAIGGINAHARILGFSPRHGGRLYSGASPLHEGILKDTANALHLHGKLCRQLERQLTPDFTDNLTAEQLEQRGRDDSRHYGKEEANG